MNAWKSFAKLTLTICISSPFFANYAQAQTPSPQNIAAAKMAVEQAKVIVQTLIVKAQGGGSGGNGGTPCESIRDARTCKATQGCYYQINRLNQSGRCVKGTIIGDEAAPLDADIAENDNAAGFALQGLGGALFRLGQTIDQMNATYGTFQFAFYWQQSCLKSGELFQANQAGKVAANLPPIGFVTSNDFLPIDVELQDVRAQLFCH